MTFVEYVSLPLLSSKTVSTDIDGRHLVGSEIIEINNTLITLIARSSLCMITLNNI